MNPHQKPQEDVVGLLPCPNPWCNSGVRPMPFVKRSGDVAVICGCDFHGPARASRKEAITAWNTRPICSYEAGRRDMREAAGKVCDGLADTAAMIQVAVELHGGQAPIKAAQRETAVTLATAIRALPTEPLGGEYNSDPE